MPKAIKVTLITLLLASLALSFNVGCTISNPLNSSPTVPAASSSPRTSTVTGTDVIDEAWQIIHNEYVEKDKINSTNMTEAAIRGMVEALNDPYTSYMSAQTYQLSRSDISGTFEGIGAFVGIRDEQLIIVAPMPDSPAEKAGLAPGDAILQVNGSPTSEMSLEEAVLRIRGPKGTSVTLQILHIGKTEPEEVKIVRAAIDVPSVTFEMKGDIAYFRIFQFSERTDVELSAKLKEMAQKDAKGIILDLRSNPGGVLSEVIKVASHFIKEGVIVSVVDNQGKKTSTSANGADIITNLPIVALSDNFSASGSEVLMGALQDYGRATVAGARTYGKGSVNTFYQLKDGSGLYITIARWLTPNGRLIEGKGIEPDIALDLHGDEAVQWAIDYLKSKRN
ncbi:MAG: PDZ domain-containing protein [Chloroflexi bacterium]|nr:PDZ domain-containing protein [Chloroflexota bacterium]